MIYKIICAGINTLKEAYKKEENEFIIAVDGGYAFAKELNLNVDYFVGDLDSFSINEKKEVEKIEHNIYKSEKDETDFELALNYVINKYNDGDKVIVYNATGGRLDHYEGALRLVKKFYKYNIILKDDINEIFVLDFWKQDSYKIKKDEYQYISFFNIYDNTRITLKGFKYELDDYSMFFNDYLCISNEIIEEGIVTCNKNLIVVKSK